MNKQVINLGSGVGSHNGDGARTGGRKINENFTEVYDTLGMLIADSSIYNKITASTGFSIVGQNLTVNANWQWLYSGLENTNPANIVVNIPFSATGKSRIEYIVPNNANGFTRISGFESTGIPTAPPIPVKDMYVTWCTVNDGSISVPAPTLDGEKYIEKREKQPFQVYKTGEINDTYIDDFFYGYLNFRDDDGVSRVTNLKSIKVYSNAHLYSGKEILIKNSQLTDITIYHLAGLPGFRFSFPNAANFVLKPNEIIRFSIKILSPTEGILEYVGKINEIPTVAVADVVGLPAALAVKVDKVAGKSLLSDTEITKLANQSGANTGDETALSIITKIGNGTVINQSYLPSYVDDILEFANLAGFPVTGETGKVYIAISPKNLQYRWTGSSYVAITNGLIASSDDVPEGFNFYFTVARFLANLTATNIKTALEITTLSGSNTGDQQLILPVTETGTSFSLTDAYNGKVVILTASCTVTIPNGLIAGFEVSLVTLTGVTLTVSLGGSVVLFNNTGLTMAEKLSCTIKNRTATNNYITAGSL